MVIWSNLAVGMIGNEDNPINLLFDAVLAIAVLGACLSRIHHKVLTYAMLAAGTFQVTIGILAGILGSDFRGGVFTIILSLPWLVSSALFVVANKRQKVSPQRPISGPQ